MTVSDPRAAIEAIWHIESPKLVATLSRLLRDVSLAEDLAQDALVVAMERWPVDGVPDNPGAWLMTTAKHRALDLLRRDTMLERKHEELARELERERDRTTPEQGATLAGDINDDMLRLMFTACHPVLSSDARAALTLRLIGGLSTSEIARAFLVPEATMAQRIVRAKKTLSAAGVPFELPPRSEWSVRLASVLEVIYLVFNEGYAATAGDDWMRPALCEDAMRLGRVLAELVPGEPEVHGLVALMELQASRLGARTTPEGDPILLPDQDRSRWNHLLIRRGVAALANAERLAARRGSYSLQAAIAACHARANIAADTNWAAIVSLYDDLLALTPSPVIELNRAVAVSMAESPAAGLAIVDRLCNEPALAGYHLVQSVRADLLQKLGRLPEARAEFELAASMTGNSRERSLLLRRASSLAQ